MLHEKLNAMKKDKIIILFPSYPSVKGKQSMQKLHPNIKFWDR